ncbi:MAG: cell wall-active antibiotics response protein [Bacillota bacterium]|nr:cell wall-active antibiotics response protein [Bacillota bacterium]
MTSRDNWWLGLVIIIVGVVILLNNFEITQIDIVWYISVYWPLLLLLWGVNMLRGGRDGRDGRDGGRLVSAGIIIALGLVLLSRNLNLIDFNISLLWKAFWPIILILFGISFVRGPRSQGKNNWALMGGLDRTKNAWRLESGNYIAFLGGISLDLRKAEIKEGEYFLSCTALMGGIDITVPTNLSVICEGSAILGGVNFLGKDNGGIFATVAESQGPKDADRVIRIYGRAMMGGIDVKAR